MEVLISIILLSSAVLNIILFFKIWGMTNDVAAIKSNLTPEAKRHTLTKLVALGEKAKAEAVAKQIIYDELSDLYFGGEAYNGTAEKNVKTFDAKLSKILPKIQRLGLEIPKHLSSGKEFIAYMNSLTGDNVSC